MPEKKTVERARNAKREGKAPSTQAGEFVREEMHHIRSGKHGAKSTKQAIAIGLSKARQAGVDVPDKSATSTSKEKTSPTRARQGSTGKKSTGRSRATTDALKREGRSAASSESLSRHARKSASERSAKDRSAAARKAARTKGVAGRSRAARKAAKTRTRD